MKIAIVNSMAPFLWGGAEELAFHLTAKLRLLGHESELFRIPFAWDPFEGLPREIVRSRLLRFDGFEQVISMKFPVYYVDAKCHSTWLVHQYRQAYDLWDSPYCNIPHDAAGKTIRDLIIAHDNEALGGRKNLFTISREISDRLKQHNGIDAEPLRAPLNDPELFAGGAYDGFILAPGRINASKRQFLLVEAMAHLGPGTRLVVAGPPETPAAADELRRLVLRHNLEDRVTLDLRFLSRKELARYVNNCRSVAYIPYMEDSYGYVTMEAFEAGKPVITVSDAGELLEIVKHQQTGIVVAPEPQHLAEAMGRYLDNVQLARRDGEAARELWRGTGINWDINIERLLGRR